MDCLEVNLATSRSDVQTPWRWRKSLEASRARGFAILRATGKQASGCRGRSGGPSGSPIDTTSHLGPPISSQRQETSSHLPLRTGLTAVMSVSVWQGSRTERNQLEPQDKQGGQPSSPGPALPLALNGSLLTLHALPHRCLQKLQPQTPFLQPAHLRPKQSRVSKNQPAIDDGLPLPTVPRRNGELGSPPQEFPFMPFPMTPGIEQHHHLCGYTPGSMGTGAALTSPWRLETLGSDAGAQSRVSTFTV